MSRGWPRLLTNLATTSLIYGCQKELKYILLNIPIIINCNYQVYQIVCPFNTCDNTICEIKIF